MASYPLPPGLQLYGAGIQNLVEGFGTSSLHASRILGEEGVGELDQNGLIKIKPNAWYPSSGLMRAYLRIEQELGSDALRRAGQSIPKHAIFPPGVHDLEGGLRSINTAYYINHGIKNEPLFNAATGKHRHNIGEYRARRDGARRVIVECENVYPCALDLGIIETVAKKFEAEASVGHGPEARCRKRKDDLCVYSVEW